MCVDRTTVAYRRVQHTTCIKYSNIVWSLYDNNSNNRYTGNAEVRLQVFYMFVCRRTYLYDLIVFGHVLVAAQEIGHGVCHVGLGHRMMAVGDERFRWRRWRPCNDYSIIITIILRRARINYETDNVIWTA